MALKLSELQSLSVLTSDGRILFSTRIMRLFAYGFLSVVLVLYLAQVGLSGKQIGLLITLTQIGDIAIALGVTTNADRFGRKRMLIAGTGLMVFAGVLFASTRDFWVLLLAATIGIISSGGYEAGPFLPIEQAALSQITSNERRTQTFAWYNLVGSFATALGSFSGGSLAQALQRSGLTPLDSYRVIVVGYALMGLGLGLLFARLSPAIEASVTSSPRTRQSQFGLHRSRRVVFKLASLISLDSFGGGFIMQSILAYWLYLQFDVEPAVLGGIFFGSSILAGCSALLAARIADRIGLIHTMVYTHIPANILTILLPLMPNLPLVIIVILLRSIVAQMDVPTRQSYTMAVVDPDERSAAAGVTNIASKTGSSLSPVMAGSLLSNPMLVSMPFFIGGCLKIGYDLLLLWNFRAIKPPEEIATRKT
ncbi:MAG: MFS transporter [Candidatus Tectomicrobia bacterium]|nr:MFS transporter [Candidatus Tectomicrobia bacterium]